MQHKELKIVYKEVALCELPEQQQNLMQLAIAATHQAYAPYSQFYVGCALQMKTGEVMTGSNQENAAYPSGLCAERTAIYHAGHTHPKGIITHIAISARSNKWDTQNPVVPCGACMQAMMEYERKQDSPIILLLYGSAERIFELAGVRALMPFQFELKVQAQG